MLYTAAIDDIITAKEVAARPRDSPGPARNVQTTGGQSIKEAAHRARLPTRWSSRWHPTRLRDAILALCVRQTWP
jgi:hypothetical protein